MSNPTSNSTTEYNNTYATYVEQLNRNVASEVICVRYVRHFRVHPLRSFTSSAYHVFCALYAIELNLKASNKVAHTRCKISTIL